MEKLTDKSYWESTYSRRNSQPPLAFNGFTNYSNRLILNKLLETDMKNKRILEIGAGDSAWLPYLAREYPSSQFTGVDYAESGCALLSDRAHQAGVNIEVVQEDMFSEDSHLHGSFDIAISLGVV